VRNGRIHQIKELDAKMNDLKEHANDSPWNASPVYFVNGKLCTWSPGNNYVHGGFYEIPFAPHVDETAGENNKLISSNNEMREFIDRLIEAGNDIVAEYWKDTLNLDNLKKVEYWLALVEDWKGHKK